MLSAQLETNLMNKKQWPVGLYDCCSYRSPNNDNSLFFPTFCPQALICSNSVVGMNYTILNDEKPCCLKFGPVGCCLCVALLPLGVYTPCSGFGIYCCLTNVLREKTKEKYNIEDKDEELPCSPFVYYGLNYPCTLFQIYATIDYYENQK